MDKLQIISLIIILIAICIYIIWLIRKNQLKDVALKLILEAEKEYQNGNEKMNYCIKKLIALVPMPFSLFITENMVRNIIQNVFDKVKELLDYQPLNKIEKTIAETIICEPVTDIDRKEGTE